VPDPNPGSERYVVRFYPPQDMIGSPSSQGGNEGVDSDGVSTVVGADTLFQAAGVPLSPGEDRLDVDQGFYSTATLFSLGNRIWLDANNDSIDNDGVGGALGSSTGIDGVSAELWTVDASGNPTGSTPAQTVTTNGTGHYLFTELPAGDYRIVIPADQFGAGGPLGGLWSSGTSESAPVTGNSDLDARDHGQFSVTAVGAIGAGGVVSGVTTLGPLSS
jgi:hypothetical protein